LRLAQLFSQRREKLFPTPNSSYLSVPGRDPTSSSYSPTIWDGEISVVMVGQTIALPIWIDSLHKASGLLTRIQLLLFALQLDVDLSQVVTPRV
jgi:hypothetical protein